MKLENGVSIIGVSAEIVLAINVVELAFKVVEEECVITSLTDGKHSRGSFHYVGMAVDFRTKHLTESKLGRLKQLIAPSLNNEFDIVWEADHLHIEFQPKRNRRT